MKTKYITLLAILGVIAMFIAAIRAVRGQGEYILTVSSEGAVTVTRTDKELHGGPFGLRADVASGTYILGTEDDAKGIYTVTFVDTTRRPGRVTLSICGSTLDIMPAGITFDQKKEVWK
ncbi:MAG: hypothetical protein AB7T27_00500 [Kiritimatiellia bacterium]